MNAKELEQREAELKAAAEKIIKRQKELDEREKTLNQKEAYLKKRELEAANAYQEKFVEKFKSVSEPLEQREKELSEREAQVARREAEAIAKDGKINEEMAEARRALEKELAQKRHEETAKLESELLSLREKRASELSGQIEKMQAALAQKQAELTSNIESEFSRLREKRLAEAEAEIGRRMQEISTNETHLKEQLSEAIKEKDAAELRAQTEADARAARESEIERLKGELSQSRSDNQATCDSLKKQCKAEYDSLSSEFAEFTERMNRQIREKDALLKNFENLTAQLGDKSPDAFVLQISELAKNQNELKDEKEALAEEREEFEREKRTLERRKERMAEREERFEDELSEKWEEKQKTLESKIESARAEAQSLREQLSANEKIIGSFDDFKAQFDGRNPAEIIADYTRVKDELDYALKKVAEYPSSLAKKEYDDIERDRERLEGEKRELDEKVAEYQGKINEHSELLQEKADLQRELDSKESENKALSERIQQLVAAYENPKEREERIKEINKPFIAESHPRMERSPESEQKWLEDINRGIENFELHYPRRILHAFHTALKTNEMSPLVVLAGVSGTGKSELPRLYAHFGGLNYLCKPVQPNWDSQEAMLGYFNSIDNFFDAQDILRLLAQTQRNPDDQNGLKDVMNLILLDEMNLANVELYFSDFLSKLETRRGCDDNHVPTLPVKIGNGSKMPDWQLPLGRNVLWAGAINQDETTKTLSDKVLDRGIVINFPRPDTLVSRKRGLELGTPSKLLKRDTWFDWIGSAKDFDADEGLKRQIGDYKHTVEEINRNLGKTGRALGHRVWQSIESYMANYPDAISAQDDKSLKDALDTAFEDQLVQKVMPKLRGIETRGIQGDSLDEIKKLIPETLHEDYENALEQGYGQFLWCSSNYMLADEKGAATPNEIPEQPAEADSENAKEELSENAKEELSENELNAAKTQIEAMRQEGKLKNPLASIPKILQDSYKVSKEAAKKYRDKLIRELGL